MRPSTLDALGVVAFDADNSGELDRYTGWIQLYHQQLVPLLSLAQGIAIVQLLCGRVASSVLMVCTQHTRWWRGYTGLFVFSAVQTVSTVLFLAVVRYVMVLLSG